MRTRWTALVCAAAVASGCSSSSSPPSLEPVTEGVQLQPAGCDFTVTSPREATAPHQDDGTVGAEPTPRNVHLSFVGDPKTTMTVTWATDVATRGTVVEWGADASYGHTTKGYWLAYATDLNGTDPPSVGVHQTFLCGLEAGSTYHYRVGTPGHMSDDFTFATAPGDGRAVRVLVAGDSRGNTSTWHDLLAAAANDAPEMILFTGDANDFGFLQDEWEAWFAAGKGVLEHLPLMMVNGNHEANMRHYYAQFPLPGNQQWYGFDFGPAHFTVLNDTPMTTDPGSIAGAQAQFLDSDLEKTQQTWKLVSHHRPEYSASTGHDSAADLQQAWEPILDSRKVDLVLTGHAHAYERSYPLAAGQKVADGAGPVYIVEGGGGANPYDVAPQPFTAFAQKIFSYVLLDISPHELELTTKAVDGTIVDSYTLSR
jgi:hypothetical protein